jgi:secreted PhoX family phosphatase
MSNHDLHDEDSNTSNNASITDIIQQRLISRRQVLQTGATVAAVSSLGLSLSACGSDNNDDNNIGITPTPEVKPLKTLTFKPVAKSLEDKVSIPEGYSYSVIVALGDPILAGTAEYKNDGTDTDFDKRSGDHHDGMEWFGLSADGKASTSAIDRGLLAMNHEATTNKSFSSFFVHANGGTNTLPRPSTEVDKEVALHGLAIVEVQKTSNKWSRTSSSNFNARITPLTPMQLSGPVSGNALVKTKYATDGKTCRGTLNNCGTGKTPWNTFLTGEENWGGYFTRTALDDAIRADKSVTSLKRYGRFAGSASRHAWETAGTADQYQRWDLSKKGTSTDGTDDYRNELNTFGYIVEMDAYDKTKKLKKRTALGRFAHESASFGIPKAGQPLSVYMGDDSKNEYMYKFVSTALWNPADATAADRLAIGDKYLDDGKLYVAKFNADSTGQWIELSINNPAIKNYVVYAFADQADVFVNARLAGDAVGATKMDRPEWGGVNPITGEIYQTLTNNSNRTLDPVANPEPLANDKTVLLPDGANPRVYIDLKADKDPTKPAKEQKGNPNGQIIRVKEGSSVNAFNWDIYLFGAEAGADSTKINLSKLNADQDFSSPDGIAFSQNTGVCWIQTDDGAYTDVTNCMMLAAIPGNIADGGKSQTLSYTKADGSPLSVVTPVGATPTNDNLKRFLVGPKGSEITGFCETPDGKAIFINIQHPGEETDPALLSDATMYQSQWPNNYSYGAGKRPRSATIVITKDDGGRIGT